MPRDRDEIVDYWVSHFTISSGIVLHIIQTQHQTISQNEAEPHQNVSDTFLLLISEKHNNHSHSLKHNQHDGIKETKGEGDDIFMNEGRDRENS